MQGLSGLQIMEHLRLNDWLNSLRTVIVTANSIAVKTAQAEYADIKPINAYALVALAGRLLASVA